MKSIINFRQERIICNVTFVPENVNVKLGPQGNRQKYFKGKIKTLEQIHIYKKNKIKNYNKLFYT
jgi:hypothetical protein